MLNTLESARLFAGDTEDGHHVYVNIELREGQHPGGQSQTIDHEPTPDFYYEASFTHTTINPLQAEDHGFVSGGCFVEQSLHDIVTPADGWDRDDLNRLAELADRWHLNGMIGACAHMTPAPAGRTGWGFVIGGSDSPEPVKRWDGSYSEPMLSHYTVNKALECPITGYRYGSAWLVRVLPDDVLAEIRSFMARPNSEPSTALQTIEEFCEKHDIQWDVEYVDENPNMPDWVDATHWELTLQRSGKDPFVSYFSMGLALTDTPGVNECLGGVVSDIVTVRDYDDFEEFAHALGEDPDSRKAEAIYKSCKQLGKKLRKFLGAKAYDELLSRTERP